MRVSESARSAQDRLRRIEGRHNPLLKELRLAFGRSERTAEGDCAIEGLRVVEEAIRSGLRFRALYFKESAQNLAERLLPQIGSHVETLLLPDKLFDGAVASETPQGVAALVRLKDFKIDDLLERLQLGPIVIVIGLQDPGNLGTITRSAEAFGSAGIVVGEGTVSPINAKVIRAAAGSLFRLPLVVVRGSEVLAKARSQGVRLIATSSHKGLPLDQAKLTGPAALLIGGEGAGLPREVLSQVDETIAIPHSPQVESLNAGVAGSIMLYEAARQRRDGRPPL